jgi:glycosyltransferase involved in cell wall biosynthesis
VDAGTHALKRPINIALGTTVHEVGQNNNSLDGIGIYTQKLLEGLSAHPQITLQPFCFNAKSLNSSAMDAGDHRRQALSSIFLGRPFSALERSLHADIVHAPDHLVPKLAHTPVVATLMDVIPLAHPEWVDYPLKNLTNRLWKHSFNWADHIITISEFSKTEIVKLLGISEKKVSSIHLGVDEAWSVAPSHETTSACLEKYGLEGGYLISVGTLQPRKNIDRLVNAHARLPGQIRAEMPLLIVGRKGWGVEKLCARLQAENPRHVNWVSRVIDEDLKTLMASARALVFPSLYEGFGLPIVEAFASGIPVLAANKTAIPEVASDAALLFDPQDEASIAESMVAIYESSSLCHQLSEAGKLRAKNFSWEETVKKTEEIYRWIRR